MALYIVLSQPDQQAKEATMYEVKYWLRRLDSASLFLLALGLATVMSFLFTVAVRSLAPQMDPNGQKALGLVVGMLLIIALGKWIFTEKLCFLAKTRWVAETSGLEGIDEMTQEALFVDEYDPRQRDQWIGANGGDQYAGKSRALFYVEREIRTQLFGDRPLSEAEVRSIAKFHRSEEQVLKREMQALAQARD